MTQDLETFLNHYMTTALWCTDDDDEAEPLDTNYGPDDIEPDSAEEMRRDCEAFLWIASGLIEAAEAHPKWEDTGNCGAFAQAAHDFWLTRNGHGVGFWETPDWPEEMGDVLSTISYRFGEAHLYVGDDGGLYHFRG